MAIQIVKAIGARVVATTSAGKVDAVPRRSARTWWSTTASDDFVEAVEDATGGRGVDVVLDVIGGDYLMRNVAAIRVGGTIVQVGVMGGGATEINLGMLLPKRAHLVGTVLRPRPLEEKVAASQRFVAEVVPVIESGPLRPVIDRRFPLADIADAHRYLETNANVGKVLIDLDGQLPGYWARRRWRRPPRPPQNSAPERTPHRPRRPGPPPDGGDPQRTSAARAPATMPAACASQATSSSAVKNWVTKNRSSTTAAGT